jgi:phosphatidylglycerophosphatase A
VESAIRRAAVAISTCAYLGYAPVAPGTVGSAAGLVVSWALRQVPLPALDLVAIVTLFVVGIWSGSVAEQHFGTEDPGPVVLDEVVGMLITLALMPVTWSVALLGFLVFRLFDVLKPYPSARFERLPGGLGVMADDAMAAVYANLVVRGAVWMVPGWFA